MCLTFSLSGGIFFIFFIYIFFDIKIHLQGPAFYRHIDCSTYQFTSYQLIIWPVISNKKEFIYNVILYSNSKSLDYLKMFFSEITHDFHRIKRGYFSPFLICVELLSICTRKISHYEKGIIKGSAGKNVNKNTQVFNGVN